MVDKILRIIFNLQITVFSRLYSNLDQNAVNNLQTNCLWVDLNGDFNNSYMKPSIIATEDASTLDGSPITSGAFYAFRKVYYLGSKVVVELLESYPNPGRIWTNSYDKNQGSWGAWNSSQNYLPLSGGTVDGVLKVGANLELKSDNEGGNISLASPNGVRWEIDAYDDNIRIFKYDPVVNGLYISRDGYISDGHGNALQDKQDKSTAITTSNIANQSVNYSNHTGYVEWNNVGNIPANVNNAINRNGDTMHGDLTMVTGRLLKWQSEARIYSPSAQHLYLCGSGEGTYFCHVGVHDGQWAFDPDANGTVALGTGNHRWTQVYAVNGAISTSDRNQKNTIKELDKRYIQLFMKLLPVSFKFDNGTSGRTHIGFISQDVEAAMAEVGLTDLEFAGFCKDQKTVPVQKATKVKALNEQTGQEEWQEITYTEDEPVEGEYVYSLRYEEFIALNTAVIQNLIKRVEALESKLH